MEEEPNDGAALPIELAITFSIVENKAQQTMGTEQKVEDEECAETGSKAVLQEENEEKQVAPERYRYCKVTFEQGNSCFYIADDSTIKDGDWVRVQYGRKQEFLIGQVAYVYECTKKSAPESPELTKHIINKTVEPYWAAARNYKLTGSVLLPAALILAGIALGLKFAFG